MSTKQLNVRLPVEMHRALARHKELTGEDKSEVIRRGIELALGGAVQEPATAADASGEASGTLEKVRALIAQRASEQPERG